MRRRGALKQRACDRIDGPAAGPVEGPAYAADLNIAAAFVVRTDEGLVEIVTPAFTAMLSEGA